MPKTTSARRNIASMSHCCGFVQPLQHRLAEVAPPDAPLRLGVPSLDMEVLIISNSVYSEYSSKLLWSDIRLPDVKGSTRLPHLLFENGMASDQVSNYCHSTQLLLPCIHDPFKDFELSVKGSWTSGRVPEVMVQNEQSRAPASVLQRNRVRGRERRGRKGEKTAKRWRKAWMAVNITRGCNFGLDGSCPNISCSYVVVSHAHAKLSCDINDGNSVATGRY